MRAAARTACSVGEQQPSRVSAGLRVQPGGEVAIRDVTDWKKWHVGYDDPEGSLPRRLAVVRRWISETLSAHPASTPMRILSLCSGDGRDLLPALADADHETVSVVLVERDTMLAQKARATASRLGVLARDKSTKAALPEVIISETDDARRRGIGRKLMEGLPENAVAAGQLGLALAVSEHNSPATRLYEKPGSPIRGRTITLWSLPASSRTTRPVIGFECVVCGFSVGRPDAEMGGTGK